MYIVHVNITIELYISTCNSTWAGAALEISQSAQMILPYPVHKKILLYIVCVSSELYDSAYKREGAVTNMSEDTADDPEIPYMHYDDHLLAYLMMLYV